MKKILFVFCVGLLVVANTGCGSTAEEKASEAALKYYEYLLDGAYQDYVGGIAYSDKMTEKYRKQLVDLSAQYMQREKDLHGGILKVTYQSGIFTDSLANVLLELHFADSTSEEISVPMVLSDGQWKLQ